MSRSRRSASKTLASGLAAGLVAAVLATGSAPPAAADPLADARARAAALAAQVDRLQTLAEVQTERYDAIQEQLGSAVVREELAQRQVERFQERADQAAAVIDNQIRALYMTGGSAPLFVTVLSGSNPADAAANLHLVGSVLSTDTADVAAAQRASAQARLISARLSATATQVTHLQQAAAAAATQVRTLLAQQQQALRSADRTVRRLVVQRQREQAAASAAAFRARLAAAGGTLNPGTAVSSRAAAIAIAAARSRLGDPYVWGATGPHAFDCSGLTQWAYAHAGVTLPRVAADQYNAGPHVALADLQPGDLLFWASDLTDSATIHHEAMYLGGGMMIAAPHTGDVVKIEAVYMDGYFGATRPYAGR